MPVTRIDQGRSSGGSSGSGRTGNSVVSPGSLTFCSPLISSPPSPLTKLGQKPFRQEYSLLHTDWSIWRLRPNGVSTGLIATQLDLTPQSPHPSQTSSL